MIKVYEDNGGWRIDVILAGRTQRTAWMPRLDRALSVAQEFAAYYGSTHEPLPIEEAK
jgi:hypothetical protein